MPAMCERNCKICVKVRFTKPQEDNESFCVRSKEADDIDCKVQEYNRFAKRTETHREQTHMCDHPEDFEPKKN